MNCNPRIWRNISCRNLESVAYDDSFRQLVCIPYSNVIFELFIILMQQPHHRRHSECSIANRTYRPIVLPNGIFQVTLRDGIKWPQCLFSLKHHFLCRLTFRIDITLDKAVRLTNTFRGIDVSIDASGTSSAVVHPNGKVNQCGSDVEVVAFDGTKRNEFM